MTRLQKKGSPFKGEITAFLSLIFLLLLSLVVALLSSAMLQVEKSTYRAKMNIALENVFAEYHQGMLKQYDLFVRAGCDEKTLSNRLQYYGMTDMSQSVTKTELLSDNQGLPYYQQAVRYMKSWLGIDGSMGGVNSSDFEMDDTVELLEEQTKRGLSDLLAQEEMALPTENNPLFTIQRLKNSSLISILVSNPEELSHRSLERGNLPSERVLHQGKGVFDHLEGEGGIAEKTMFLLYLQEHFSDASEGRNLRALSYELEYILCGNQVDKDNLEAVLQKILKIRLGLNFAYLQTDETKKAEADLMAFGLCAVFTTPGIQELVKQAILLAWAYGESIVDLRVLMQQDAVPLWKTSATWQLELSNLITLGTSEEISGARYGESGLCYQDYLKGLLMLEEREALCMRSLDLIESNLSVRVDECMTKAEVESTRQLREGIWDKFQTMFQYQ